MHVRGERSFLYERAFFICIHTNASTKLSNSPKQRWPDRCIYFDLGILHQTALQAFAISETCFVPVYVF